MMVRLLRRALPRTFAEWLVWQSTLLLALLFVLSKVIERLLVGHPRWHSFGRIDLATLFVLAVLVGACNYSLHRRVQRTLDEAEAKRSAAEALAHENEAVVRVCLAVVHEFAQPLSGALAYSEMLMARHWAFDADGRREVEGLREGVLQLERLLGTLRQAAQGEPVGPEWSERRLADDVEHSIGAPHPRMRVGSPDPSLPRAGS